MNVKASKEQGGARERLRELYGDLNEDIEKVDLDDEKCLVAFMTVGATHLADRQAEVEKQLLLCAKAATSGGKELAEEWQTSTIRRDAEMIVGKCLFIVCLFTVTLLYRGPAFGKK